MEIEILQQQCGGTEFLARPHRLHLGAQNAEGVDQLHFIPPDDWAGCTLALYLRHRDGTQLAPIPLDGENRVTVDRRLTGSTGGQWMLAAVQGEHYTAYTRPGSYEVYPTLPTDGGSEELPPSLYEQFVARVLESARSAAESARKAAANASDTAAQAELAQNAADKILADRTDAADCARRAEEAAHRAELAAPEDGKVVSVNGKGGIVRLTAQDTGAVPCPAQTRPGEVVRILSVDASTGAVRTDTAALPDLHPYVRSDTIPTADTTGPVRADRQYGVAVRGDATLTTVPAAKEQLDSMSDAYAPVTPALLPYGVKKALTSAASAGEWSEPEKAAALQQLGADSRFYPRAEADRKFGAPYTLPPATAAALGGIKVGRNLTVDTDGTLGAPDPYTLTREKITAALGYTPVSAAGAAQLPYTIVYDQSYVGTGTQQDYAGNDRTITLHGDYDAVGVITTNNSNYPVGTEKARQCVLKELVTLESPITAFCQNYITLKGLPTTSTAANKLNMTGLVVIYNHWTDSDTSVSYKDRVLRLTDNTTTNNYGTYSWNDASKQYHVFGITLDSSILPVSDADMEDAGGKV